MRVVCVTYVALLFLAVGWLVAAIMAIDRYHEAAGNRRRLAKRFLIVTTIELAIIGLVSAAIYVLTGLV
jgi:putative copper export protein